MIVTDYDGTFYTDDINARKNIEAVTKFMRKNNYFIIATGRTLIHFKEKILKQGINVPYNYIICADGGCIFDCDDRLLYSENMGHELAGIVLSALNSDNNFFDISFSDGYNKYRREPYDKINVIGVRYHNEKRAKALMERLRKQYPIDYRFLNEWIKIMSSRASKGNAISLLANTFKLNKANIYVIGNEENDISMITMFNGYAMKDSADIVKQLNVKEYNQVYELIDDVEKI
jgi:HAD superfamily hydrolase (TIGR01484 family)